MVRLFCGGDVKFCVVFVFFLTSCSYIDSKIGDYYFSRAKKISSKHEISESEVERFYTYIIKAVEKKKNLPQAVEMVEMVTDASVKAGYLKAYDNQLKFYLRYIEINPHAWNVYLSIINFFSLKGDIHKLLNLVFDFEKRSFQDPHFKLLSFIAQTNLLYWFESYGYLSISDDYDTVRDYLSKYCSSFKSINDIVLLDKQGYFKNADPTLYYYYFTSLNDLLSKEDSITKNCEILNRIKSNSNYSKIIRYFVSGNHYLSKQEYANAIMYYRAALNMNENFIEAKKGLIESEFQNLLSISLMKKSNEELINFVYDRLSDLDEIIAKKRKGISSPVPFMSDDRFISSLFTLKAAMLGVVYENEKNIKKKENYHSTIRSCLDEAIKYDPTNRLARDLYERFVKK
ncbi:MAG: hypothetical protein ACP5IO_04660 [Elusimicrobiales bacterium]